MQLAIITPVNYLSFSNAGDFFFSLAHVLKESETKQDSRYRDFFLQKSQSGNTVFLDNGAHEEELVDGNELFELGKSIEATHIICPDSLGNYEQTLEFTSKFLELPSPTGYNPKFIGVCQANSWDEFLKLYKHYLETNKIDTIAIPYDLELFPIDELGDTDVDKQQLEAKVSYRNMKTRIRAMFNLVKLGLFQKNIHLLGWSLPQEIWYQNQVARKHLSKLSNDSQGYCVYPEKMSIRPNMSLREQLMKLDTKLSTPPDFFREIPMSYHAIIEMFIYKYKKELNKGE